MSVPPSDQETPEVNSVIYEFDDTEATDQDREEFRKDLLERLRYYVAEKIEFREVSQTGDRVVSKVLNETDRMPKGDKVILASPDANFSDNDNLVETFRKLMQGRGGRTFVAVIICSEKSGKFRSEFYTIQTKWNTCRCGTRQKVPLAKARKDLQDALVIPETIKIASLNLGNCMACSYYFGYLIKILPMLKEMDLREYRVSQRIFIIFTKNCQEPKKLNSKRIIWKKNIKKEVEDKAGGTRSYDFDIREVKSKDGKESYCGVVCYLNVVELLLEMKNEPDQNLVKCTNDDVRTQSKDCFEKLKLIVKYNEETRSDQAIFDFIEFDNEPENADENKLADVLVEHMKKTSNAVQETGQTVANQIGAFFVRSLEDIREFVDGLESSGRQITTCYLQQGIEFGLDLIRKSKRIFMVLTDEFVECEAFAPWFYAMLDKGFEENDRRFVVCLNRLHRNDNNLKVQELKDLFTSVSDEDQNWGDQVKDELGGAVEAIEYLQLFRNLGRGLALSWFFRFLKIRVPKLIDIINSCSVLKEKFQQKEMSHEVFILLPKRSCKPKKVAEGVNVVDITPFPKITKGNRDYTPKVYEIDKYYAFVEFTTPAVTMNEMMEEKFLRMGGQYCALQNECLEKEWSEFKTQLHKLIKSCKKSMDLNTRITIEGYTGFKDDSEVKGVLLAKIKVAIDSNPERMMPRFIDNGATVTLPQ